MRAYAEEALELLGERSLAELASDRRTLLAVSRATEIVGEAASQVSRDIAKAYPKIPFEAAISMRHHPIHGYGSIDLAIIRETVRDDFPILLQELERR